MPHAQNAVGDVLGWIIIFPLALITLTAGIGWLLGGGQPDHDKRPAALPPGAPRRLRKPGSMMTGIHNSGRCCRECGEPHSSNEAVRLTNVDRMAYLDSKGERE